MSGRSFCSWPFAGFAGWLFPFQGRSLASALAGPAVLNAGWINQAAVHHWRYGCSNWVAVRKFFCFERVDGFRGLWFFALTERWGAKLLKTIWLRKMGHPKGVVRPEIGLDLSLAAGAEVGSSAG
jgi:hypothetical protein